MKLGDEDNDRGQMLLATGMVLLMSLLSMANISVRLVGLGEPYDMAEGDVLRTVDEVETQLPGLVETRTRTMIADGVPAQQAIEQAVNSTTQDLYHHGMLRGLDVVLLTETIESNAGGSFFVNASLGIADDETRIEVPIHLVVQP
mgnify:FL=1